MRNLAKLGFEKYRNVNQDVKQLLIDDKQYLLPEEYLKFLEYQQPNNVSFAFKFIHAASGEEWEGCICEFFNIAPCGDDLSSLENTVVRTDQYPNSLFFPVASDPGGNYIYLDLASTRMPVVDVDYQSGVLSQIAPDFGSFLDKLYDADDL